MISFSHKLLLDVLRCMWWQQYTDNFQLTHCRSLIRYHEEKLSCFLLWRGKNSLEENKHVAVQGHFEQESDQHIVCTVPTT